MAMYLHCGLCGRKQAEGLLSRAAWGLIEHEGRKLRACPACQATHRDWAERLQAVESGSTARYGGAYRPQAPPQG